MVCTVSGRYKAATLLANVCVVFRKGDMSEDALRRSALARENMTQANEFGQTMQASLRKSARRSSL